MSFVSVPAVISSADKLLPVARLMIDEETATIEADLTIRVSCRPQCNACCEHAVTVTPAEARAIAAEIAELPSSTQESIRSRAADVLARMDAEAPPDTDDFPRRYYELREPCPLLIDGRCSVREVRPLVCREYLMSSAPEHCDDRSLENAVQIRRRRDVSTRFQEISAHFDDAAPRLLPTALLDAAEEANETPLSGAKLARLLARG